MGFLLQSSSNTSIINDTYFLNRTLKGIGDSCGLLRVPCTMIAVWIDAAVLETQGQLLLNLSNYNRKDIHNSIVLMFAHHICRALYLM